MKKQLRNIYWTIIKAIFPAVYQTRGTAAPITPSGWFIQKIVGINRGAYWPTHFTSKITNVKNIEIGIGTAPGLSPGCYIQGGGKIKLGNYSIVGPNVGLISSNHDPLDISKNVAGEIKIGDYCWIGMNAVILPNTELGDFTIVGAGTVVTKSFPEGYQVIAGNPAKVIKKLKAEDCVKNTNEHEFRGYIREKNFADFKNENLDV